MKKSLKIVLAIIVVIIAIIAFLTVWQWENIKSIYMGITYSDEKIETKINETKEKLGKELEKEGIVNQKIIEGFSKEDEEKLAKGEITVEEAVEKLFEPEKDTDGTETTENAANEADLNGGNTSSDNGNNVSDSPSVPEESNEPVSEPQDDNAAKAKTLIEAAVKEMYTLKATFVQQLATIERTAKKMYVQEGMTKEKKMEIADRMMPQFIAAEKDCDSKVEAILSQLKTDLESIGADTSVVEYIREQYDNEKQLQKSKYINKYL